MANEYAVNKADLEAVADAIRTKGGTSDALTFPGGFVDAVGAIQAGGGGGDDGTLTAFVNGTLTDFVAPEGVTTISAYRFYGMKKLKTADLRTVTDSIGVNAFNGCSVLETVLMPESMKALQPFTGGNFTKCVSLKRFEYKGGGSGYSANSGIFSGCTGLEEARLPNFSFAGAPTAFQSCSSLRFVDMKGSIGANFFNGCTALKTIVNRNASVASLANVSAFTNTPFASGGTGGTVYIPQALIESYQTATNWSTLYTEGTVTFLPIEGSEYE